MFSNLSSIEFDAFIAIAWIVCLFLLMLYFCRKSEKIKQKSAKVNELNIAYEKRKKEIKAEEYAIIYKPKEQITEQDKQRLSELLAMREQLQTKWIEETNAVMNG